jgi:dolichol-phosphate mannosyltransferase
MTDVEIRCDTGVFGLVTRRVLDLLVAMSARHRVVGGLVSWIGGKRVPRVYDGVARAAGEGKYPFAKALRGATGGFTSFSMVPLRLSVIVGWVMAFIGCAVVIYSVQGALLGHPVPGGSVLMAGIGLLTGTQFLIGDMVGGRGEGSVAAEELAGVLFPSSACVSTEAGWR